MKSFFIDRGTVNLDFINSDIDSFLSRLSGFVPYEQKLEDETSEVVFPSKKN